MRAYVEADRGFIDAVTAGTAPEPAWTRPLVAHRLVDAAYRSAAGGGAPVGENSIDSRMIRGRRPSLQLEWRAI